METHKHKSVKMKDSLSTYVPIIWL